jgi:hypothetical protein
MTKALRDRGIAFRINAQFSKEDKAPVANFLANMATDASGSGCVFAIVVS